MVAPAYRLAVVADEVVLAVVDGELVVDDVVSAVVPASLVVVADAVVSAVVEGATVVVGVSSSPDQTMRGLLSMNLRYSVK
mmetsp:Transcript_63697/g.184749  ORF Transcript_63697/g.184749 Transcript_63697/m.184749 type:complete len:81 (-) Transcript_63697:1086-1328(-)